MKFSQLFKWKSSPPDPTDGEERPRHIVSALYGEAAARRYINARNELERQDAERHIRGEAFLVDALDQQRRRKTPSPPRPDPQDDPRQHVAQAIMSNDPNLYVPRRLRKRQRPMAEDPEDDTVSTTSSFSRYNGPWVRSDGTPADVSPVHATPQELQRVKELCAEYPTPYYSVTHQAPPTAKRRPVARSPSHQHPHLRTRIDTTDIADRPGAMVMLPSPVEPMLSPIALPYTPSAHSPHESLVDRMEELALTDIRYADYADAAANQLHRHGESKSWKLQKDHQEAQEEYEVRGPGLRRSDAIKRKPGGMWMKPHWHTPASASKKKHAEEEEQLEADTGHKVWEEIPL